MPGSDSMYTLGLLISRARVYQEIGSKQTVAPVYRCRPIGTPIIGVVEPVPNGHMPHTWTVVPRYSIGASTYDNRPPPGPAYPVRVRRGIRIAGYSGSCPFLVTTAPISAFGAVSSSNPSVCDGFGLDRSSRMTDHLSRG